MDHNVSLRVVPTLFASGHDVIAARELGAARLPDNAQLLSPAQAGRTLVTHDRHDFTMLHDAWLSWPAAYGLALPPHSGILVLDRATPDEIIRTLGSFLAAIPSDRLANGLFWWHHLAGWRWRLTATGWEPYP